MAICLPRVFASMRYLCAMCLGTISKLALNPPLLIQNPSELHPQKLGSLKEKVFKEPQGT